MRIIIMSILFLMFNLPTVDEQTTLFKDFIRNNIAEINDRSNNNTTIVQKLNKYAENENVNIRVYAKFILAISVAEPANNFESANMHLESLCDLIKNIPDKQKKEVISEYFRDETVSINIRKITVLRETMMRGILQSQNFDLLEGLSKYFYLLAKSFYIFSTPTEMCGNSPCLNDYFYIVSLNNRLISKFFYNSNEQVKKRTDQIKLWYIDIFKHAPEK